MKELTNNEVIQIKSLMHIAKQNLNNKVGKEFRLISLALCFQNLRAAQALISKFEEK